MRALTITLTLLLASGCSFIQDWGDLRPEGGFDAGLDPDGGSDSGGACVTTCMDCPAGTDCVETSPGCVECIPMGGWLNEGDSCNDSSECMAGLSCPAEVLICVRECNTAAECFDSVFGPHCADLGGWRICMGSQCDPVYPGSCGGVPCTIAGVDPESFEAISLCAGEDPIYGPNEECDPTAAPGTNLCEDGYHCLDSGAGIGRCQRLCYLNDGCPDFGYAMCTELWDPRTGGRLLQDGELLGTCGGRDSAIRCLDDTECPIPGDHCTRIPGTPEGFCSFECFDDTECFEQGAFGGCRDYDGDSRTECGFCDDPALCT